MGIYCCLFVAVCASPKLSPGVCLPAGESPTYASVLNIGNMVFTGFFCIEMAMKLFALNFFEYLCDAFNIFDAVVVIISVVEIALEVGSRVCSSASMPSQMSLVLILLGSTSCQVHVVPSCLQVASVACLLSLLLPRPAMPHIDMLPR